MEIAKAFGSLSKQGNSSILNLSSAVHVIPSGTGWILLMHVGDTISLCINPYDVLEAYVWNLDLLHSAEGFENSFCLGSFIHAGMFGECVFSCDLL